MVKIFLILIIIIDCFVYAGSGTSTASFLKIGIGARPAGMGDAFVALADDVNAVYWNPAGLDLYKGIGFSVTHLEWLQNIHYENLLFKSPVKNYGSIGIMASFLYFTGIPLTVRSSETMEGFYRDGEFGFLNMVFAFSYSKQLMKNFSLGLSFKYLSMNINKTPAMGVAFDFGFIWRFLSHFAFGGVVKNLGPSIRFLQKRENLPIVVRLGLKGSWNIFKTKSDIQFNDLSILFDVDWSDVDLFTFNSGIEIWFLKRFAVRLGGWLRIISGSIGGYGFTTGLGFYFKKFYFDASFAPYRNLGFSYRFSITGIF